MGKRIQRLSISEMPEEKLNEELEKGWRDIVDGRCKDAEKVFAEILSAPDKQDARK